MIQLKVSIPLMKLTIKKVVRQLVSHYLWYFFFLNIYIIKHEGKIKSIKVKLKKRTILSSPKCYKRGQRSLRIKNRSVIIMYSLNKNKFSNWESIIKVFRKYLLFYNQFLRTHNCYLVRVGINTNLSYSITNKLIRW